MIMSLTLVASLAACGLQEPEAPETPETPAEEPGEEEPAEEPGEVEPEVTLVYAEVNPLDTIVGQTDQAFADKVHELSGGKIKMKFRLQVFFDPKTTYWMQCLAAAAPSTCPVSPHLR